MDRILTIVHILWTERMQPNMESVSLWDLVDFGLASPVILVATAQEVQRIAHTFG